MKKQFVALLGGILVAGLAMAAEVVGNNEAVVIQKEKVESSNGFQFLCVPVAPLDITGGSTATFTLAQVLPPELYTTSTRVTRTVYDEEQKKDVKVGYKIAQTTPEDSSTNKWVTDSGVDANNTVLNAGEIFWLNSKDLLGSLFATSYLLTDAAADTNDAIVFCGQSVDAGTVSGTQGQMVACANASSEAKTLSKLISDPTNRSTVYIIEDGKTEYKTYTYYKYATEEVGQWYVNDPKTGGRTAEDATIAAGEAFYYLKK